MTTDVTLQTLLAHLDGLSFGERVRHVVDLARAGETGPKALALIDTMLAGDAYEASLAIEMAQAVRDVHRLAAALAHRSFGVRRLAAGYLVRLVPDAPVPADSPDKPVSPAILDLPALIHGLAPALRRTALKGLVRHGRRAAARALFPGVLASFGPREAAALLPALDAATLRAHLPALAHAAPSWRAILQQHPAVALEHLRDQLAAAPQRDRTGVWLVHRGLLSALAELRPIALLELLAEFPDTCPPYSLFPHLGELARADAARTLELLERRPMRDALRSLGLPRPLLTHLACFTEPQRVRLGVLVGERPELLVPLLRELAPGQRGALFDAVYADQGREHRVWPDVLLDSLPHAVSRREATRMLALPVVQADPDRVLALTVHLGLAHAAPLQHALRAADADERGRAVARTITCAARDTTVADGLTTTLGQLAPRLRNDQDPVRLAAFHALAQVPADRFTAADADLLRALTNSAIEARDTSWATRQQIQQIAFKLLRGHAGIADGVLFTAGLDLLVLLAGQSGTLTLPDLSRGLPKRTAPALLAALAPRLAAATARERPELLFALATALGERARGLTALTDQLEALTAAKPDSVASRAVTLLLADPRGRDERVRKLIAADRSAIVLQPVLDHLHRRRQAWLDPFLDGSKISGRFLTGKTVHLLPVSDGFHRWLPRQQHAFARLVARLGHDKDHPQLTRAAAVQRLAALPVTTIADLEPYLHSDEVIVVEAALGALPWIDSPADALPVLLEHLDSDRARVAMYAVPRVARFIPADALATTLIDLLTGKPRKLTVRKEAVRLLGVHRTPRSLPTLFELLAQPNLPKDLAIAVGHAARSLLDDPRAHGLLATLACSPEPDVARSLLGPRPEHLPAHARHAYARLVLAVARHPDLTTRRSATLTLPTWSSGQEEEVTAHLADVVLDLDHGATWSEATGALVSVCSERSEALAPLARVIAGLASRADDPGPDPARDLPARQRLLTLFETLAGQDATLRLSLRPGLTDLATHVVADDLWPVHAGLRILGLDLADPSAEGALRDLAADPRADTFGGDLIAHLERQVTGVAPEHLLARAAALAPASHVAARLALVLVTDAGQRGEWPPAAAAALAELRAHPSLLVRADARAVFTRPEATA